MARPRRPIVPPPAVILGAVAVLAASVVTPTSASPTNTVTFRLTNTTAANVSEMSFSLVPRGTILPPVIGTAPDGSPIEGSPMRALPSSTGIDTSSAYVLLTDDPADPDMERMFLLFGYEPDPDAAPGAVPFSPLVDASGARVGQLSPGGAFDFELDLAQPALAYLIKPAVDGLVLNVLDDLPPPNPGGGPVDNPTPTDPGTPIPEPGALLLWSALGFGALALRHRRRMAASPC